MNLVDLFKSIEDKLQADLQAARSSIEHAPSKGAANEKAAIEFLRSRIPRNLDLSSGFLVDSKGGVSRQLDIIIHDTAKTPILYEKEGLRVIPVECAYAVIEVKTVLSRSDFESCIKNMKSAKSLIKSAFYEEGIVARPTLAYGSEYKDWPLMYFVFAYESSPLHSIADWLNREFNETPIDKRIDSIFSLERGLVTNVDGDKAFAIPNPSSKIAIYKKDSLLLFYSLIIHYLNQVYMRNFRFSDYLGSLQFDGEMIEYVQPGLLTTSDPSQQEPR